MAETRGPRKGEKWAVGSLDDLIFLGQGVDHEGTKHFIFEDPIDEMFVIKKDSFFSPDMRKKLEALAN